MGLSMASVGISPCSTKRHSAMAKRRAQRDDADAAHALAAMGEALVEPAAELTVRLQPQPAPRQLHQQCAHALVARLADALFDVAIATAVRGGGHAEAACELAPMAEAARARHLLDQRTRPASA